MNFQHWEDFFGLPAGDAFLHSRASSKEETCFLTIPILNEASQHRLLIPEIVCYGACAAARSTKPGCHKQILPM